jgi:hypothetical protein
MNRREFVKKTIWCALSAVCLPSFLCRKLEAKIIKPIPKTPYIVINGERYDIVPNSFTYDGGDIGVKTHNND